MQSQTPINSIKVYVADLAYINEAVKATKQKNVALINNTIVGLDNLEHYVCYTVLDPNMINNIEISYLTVIINSAELSAFVSHLTTESLYEYNTSSPVNTWNTLPFKDHENGVPLSLSYDRNMLNFVQERLNMVKRLEADHPNAVVESIDDKIQKLREMKKTDGSFYLVHNGLFITMFPGLLPLVKVDKVFLSIFDTSNTSFVAKFIIRKKKFEVFIYLAYLKVN